MATTSNRFYLPDAMEMTVNSGANSQFKNQFQEIQICQYVSKAIESPIEHH